MCNFGGIQTLTIHCRTLWINKNSCLCECVKVVHALSVCVCVCGSCPLESEGSGCPITTNTAALCTRHHTTRCRTDSGECHTWALLLLLLLLIYRFRSQTCRGRPPRWDEVMRRITRCTDGRTVRRTVNPPYVRKLGHLIGHAVQLLSAPSPDDRPQHCDRTAASIFVSLKR